MSGLDSVLCDDGPIQCSLQDGLGTSDGYRALLSHVGGSYTLTNLMMWDFLATTGTKSTSKYIFGRSALEWRCQ